jgi:hypothetical protein
MKAGEEPEGQWTNGQTDAAPQRPVHKEEGALGSCGTFELHLNQFWVWIGKVRGCCNARVNCNMLDTWKLRNMACFEKKNIKNHGEILFYACALIQYWVLSR